MNLLVAAVLDLLLTFVPASVQEFSVSYPPSLGYKCGRYPIRLHASNDFVSTYKYVDGREVIGFYETLPSANVVDMGMRVGHIFVDGGAVKGFFHVNGFEWNFYSFQRIMGNYEFSFAIDSNPSERLIRVFILEDNSQIKCNGV